MILRTAAATMLVLTLSGCGSSDDRTRQIITTEPPSVTAPPADQGSAQLKWFNGPDGCEQVRHYLAASLLASLAEEWLALRADIVSAAADGRAGSPPTLTPKSPRPTSKPSVRPVAESLPPTPSVLPGYRPLRARAPKPGVDEADFVRRDGNALWLLTNSAAVEPGLSLHRVDLLEAGALAATPILQWYDQSSQFGDEAIWGLHPVDEAGLAVLTTGVRQSTTLPRLNAPDQARLKLPAALAVTRLRLVDTAKPVPDPHWQTDLPGRLLASRRIGEHLQLVTATPLALPAEVVSAVAFDSLRFSTDPVAAVAAIDRQISVNEAAARALSLSDWLAALGLEQPPDAAQCAQMARVDAPTRPGLLTLTTIDLTTGLRQQRVVLAHADAIHQARYSLLIASPSWARGASASTYLHRFTVEATGALDYHGSATTEGTLSSTDALDERDDGIVRVAAREEAPSGQTWTHYLANWQPQAAPAHWQLLGRSDPLLAGETLARIEFLADRALLATTLASDPLYLVNLALPGRPANLGTLDILGRASWVSAIDSHLLLTVSDGGSAGAVPPLETQLTASLFDIGAADHPLLLSRLALGAYTTSPAFNESRAAEALTWSGSSDTLLAVTVQASTMPPSAGMGPFGIGLVSVEPALGSDALHSLGVLDTSLLDPQIARFPVRPLLTADYLYVATPHGVRSATVADPATTIDTVRLDQDP